MPCLDAKHYPVAARSERYLAPFCELVGRFVFISLGVGVKTSFLTQSLRKLSPFCGEKFELPN